VNAPIQDAYHFDIRPGLEDLWVLKTGAYPNAPVGPGQPAPSSALRNAGRELFDLIQLSVAYNTDPSVAVGSPNANVSSFDLGVNGTISLVNWDANAGITQYELAVIATKILGKEADALKFYTNSPTFSDVEYDLTPLKHSSKGKSASLFFDRAAAYYNYFDKHIVEENAAFSQYTTKNPAIIASRLDVVELIVRLAQAKFDELKDVSDYVDETFAKQIGFDTARDKSIVSFAITLDEYLSDGIGWNNSAVNGKTGFLYAFEFFFLSEVKATEISPEMLTANQMIELQQNGQNVTLNVPVLFLDEFRIYFDGKYKMLERFNSTRDFYRGTNYAERFWAVALFSKIFNTEKKVVTDEDYVPTRELNNVVVYKKNNAKGQLSFGSVEYVEGFNGKKELLTCKNTAYPAYLDPQDPDLDNVLENPELNYYVYELSDATKVVLTDMTTWDVLDENTISTKVGNNFYDYYPNSTTREITRDYTGYGFYNEETDVLDNAVIYDDKTVHPSVLNFFENSVDMGAEYDSYMIFIPTVEDFAKGPKNTLFRKSVQDVIDNPNRAISKYVNVAKDMDAKTLVNKEAVVFDAKFKQFAGQPDKVKFLYAKDRLNHKDEYLTLEGIETFLKRYYGEFSLNNGELEAESFVDRIEALSPEGYADQPMLAYYVHMYKALMEAGLPMETKLVAVVKTEEVPKVITPTFDNFRTIEQLYGQVNELERFIPDPVNSDLLKKHKAVKGNYKPAEIVSEYEIYPVIKDACVKEKTEEPKDVPTGDSSIQGCCTYDLNKGDFIVSFDAYVQNDFVFPGGSTMIAEFDADRARTTTPMSTLLDNPKLLLDSKFGFTGPAVKEVFVSRSIKPLKPLLEDDNTVILKVYK